MVRGDVAEAGEARTRRARLALLGLAALLFVAVRVPFVSVPLERDEGEYAYIAQRALHGEVPYRDAFDQKPPGIFAIYLAAFAVFGASVEGIHLFMYAWTLLSCAALDALVRRAAGGLAAAFAVLGFAVLSVDPRLAATAANTEIFMLLPLVASTALLLRAVEGDGAGAWLGCGALAAAACWIKPVAAVQGPLAALVVAALAGRRPPGRRLAAALRGLGLLALGALAVSLPLLLGLAAVGALGAFADAVIVHNFVYAGRLPLSQGIHNLGDALRVQAPGFGVLWLLALAGLAWPRALPRGPRLLLGGFALTSLAGVASGLYFRLHYFVQALPALAALAGVAAAALARPGLARSGWAAGAAVAAAAALLVAPPLIANQSYLRGSPSEISREIYGMNPFVESVRIADYIRRTSQPEDRIYLVGSEPQILFHAERRSATRYIFFYPLTGPFPDALERQRELMREVQAARPLYVVWIDLKASLLTGDHSERWVLDATAEMLERHYGLEFLAVPPEAGPLRTAEFEFVYGREARELLERMRSEKGPAPWIAVFRRVSPRLW